VRPESIVANEPRPLHPIDQREPRQVSIPILVVEDDPQLRIMFQLLLEGEGYPVVAADGLEALRAVRTMPNSAKALATDRGRIAGEFRSPCGT
jgi:F420-dependent methylenetetrahydromethanopterin dehydrogenase